jgi:hypothetical protein
MREAGMVITGPSGTGEHQGRVRRLAASVYWKGHDHFIEADVGGVEKGSPDESFENQCPLPLRRPVHTEIRRRHLDGLAYHVFAGYKSSDNELWRKGRGYTPGSGHGVVAAEDCIMGANQDHHFRDDDNYFRTCGHSFVARGELASARKEQIRDSFARKRKEKEAHATGDRQVLALWGAWTLGEKL